MAKRKHNHELLTPAGKGWAHWRGTLTGGLDFNILTDEAGSFEADVPRRVLALPAAAVWTLPAWLKGDKDHLRDMATLHLERMGVRLPDPAHEMLTEIVSSDDGGHLCAIAALKELPSPLEKTKILPTQVTLSAHCFHLPPDCLVVWEEHGSFVIAITVEGRLVYFSPLSARHLDDAAMREINNICLQLGFQRVIGRLEAIVLWTDAGDLDDIADATGLTVRRDEKPAPRMPAEHLCSLMPADIIATRHQQQRSARTRLMALGAGAIGAICVAVLTALTALAVQERNTLFERLAELTPKAARVQDHQRSWGEVATAVDPKRFPMQVLLHCMEPSSAPEVAITHFQCTAEKIVLRGRTEKSPTALQYSQEIKNVEPLMAWSWETPQPVINPDDSASFEVTGVRQ